jgi:phage shock protein A
MNHAELVEALAEAALKLGLYDLARNLARERLLAATDLKEHKAALDKLAQIGEKARAELERRARQFRINRANASDSVYMGQALSQ